MTESVTAATWAAAQLADWGLDVAIAGGAGDAIRDWIDSGVPAITGRPDGPALVPPGAAATAALGCEAAFAALADVTPDRTWHRLLAKRATLNGWQRRGPWSLGGSCRAIRCADGFVAVNLARREDVDSVAAVVEHDRVVVHASAAWGFLDQWAAGVSTDEAVVRLRLLDVPAGVVPPPGAWWPDSAVEAHAACSPVVRTELAQGPGRTEPPLVVDLSSLWAGPLCTALLGRAGARVIKVEAVSRPDGAREGNGEFYEWLHSGQQSLVIEPSDTRDRQMLAQLLDDADIVVESSRPRALRSWGIDARDICAKRSTTWVSITAYGQRFPDRVGFGDDVAMASGLVARDADDWPLPCGDALADPLTGMHAAVHALASHRVGGGRILDVAMAEVVAGTVAWSPAGATPVGAG